MLAGPGIPGIDILVAQGQLINRAAGAPEAVVEMNARVQRKLADIAKEENDLEKAGPRMRSAMREEIALLPQAITELIPDNSFKESPILGFLDEYPRIVSIGFYGNNFVTIVLNILRN